MDLRARNYLKREERIDSDLRVRSDFILWRIEDLYIEINGIYTHTRVCGDLFDKKPNCDSSRLPAANDPRLAPSEQTLYPLSLSLEPSFSFLSTS